MFVFVKRFTASEKWAKEWFQNLPCRLKCFWMYLCDNVDAAGVWEPNFRMASFVIGEEIKPDDLSFFGDRIAKMENGKWLIVDFIEFQYGQLSEACKAHSPVYRAIAKHRLSIPYAKAIHSLKEEEEEKVMEKEPDKGVRSAEERGREGPTREAALAAAKNIGIDAIIADTWWNDRQSTGWLNGKGMRILQWQNDLTAYGHKCQSRKQENHRNGTNNHRSESDRDHDRTGLHSTAGQNLKRL